MIKTIKASDLRRMNGKEGLILQGCGGSLDEWLDGINELLTKEGILLNETKFHNIVSFKNENLTCLLFPFSEDIKLDMGKLAMWRIVTHSSFGGAWLSDFVENKLGGFINENESAHKKPDCPLIGQDGNIFNLMGIASRTLRQNGMADEATKMCEQIRASENYDKALNIIGEYVNIVSVDESEDMDEDEGMGGM